MIFFIEKIKKMSATVPVPVMTPVPGNDTELYYSDLPFMEGPWSNDMKAHQYSRYTFTAHGLKCMISRNSFGTWCGYVDVNPDLNVNFERITVHGGITGGSFGESTENFIGFDTMHFGDMLPGKDYSSLQSNDLFLLSKYNPVAHYWTFEDTVAEVTNFARQISLLL